MLAQTTAQTLSAAVRNECFKSGRGTTNKWLMFCCVEFPCIVQVTGGNKGIGFAIVKSLATQFEGDVILAGTKLRLLVNS